MYDVDGGDSMGSSLVDENNNDDENKEENKLLKYMPKMSGE